MSVEAYDLYRTDLTSNCCGATIIEPDFCAECLDHCEPIEDEEN